MSSITHEKYALRSEIGELMHAGLRWKNPVEIANLVGALTDSLACTMNLTDLKAWAAQLASTEAYFAEPGCTCRRVEVGNGSIIVGGQDDCPVHGFGVAVEEEE